MDRKYTIRAISDNEEKTFGNINTVFLCGIPYSYIHDGDNTILVAVNEKMSDLEFDKIEDELWIEKKIIIKNGGKNE